MEQWKPVVGWEGVYEVSDLGRVKRLVPGKRTYAGRIFDQSKSPDGYRTVTISFEGRKQTRFVHHLVLEAFVGARPTPRHAGNHKDGDRRNNRPGNLEWATYSENNLHSYRVLGKAPPSQSWKAMPFAKLDPGQASEIRRIRAETGATSTVLAGRFGVSKSTVCRLLRGETWR